MLKRTSKNGLVLDTGTLPPDGFLADFDIDGHDLKYEHIEWLEQRIVRRDKARSSVKGKWLVRLTGRASQSGSVAHNQALSGRRIDAVARYLKRRIMPNRMDLISAPLGEGAPIDSGIYENEMDRSVHVEAEFRFHGKFKRLKPHFKPKIKPWRRRNRMAVNFTIQVLKAQVEVTSVGGPVVPMKKGNINVFLFLEIWEAGTGDTALYEFRGNGSATHWDKPGPGLSEWLNTFENGNKHGFATKWPLDAEDFGGFASMRIEGPHKGVADGYRFGPPGQDSFWFPEKTTIKELTFGKSKKFIPPSAVNTAAGVVTGEMKLISKRPSWAD